VTVGRVKNDGSEDWPVFHLYINDIVQHQHLFRVYIDERRALSNEVQIFPIGKFLTDDDQKRWFVCGLLLSHTGRRPTEFNRISMFAFEIMGHNTVPAYLESGIENEIIIV
jgi:hypothetical protein